MTPMQAWNLEPGEYVTSRVIPGYRQAVLWVYTSMGSTFVKIANCQTDEITIAYPSDLSRLEPGPLFLTDFDEAQPVFVDAEEPQTQQATEVS